MRAGLAFLVAIPAAYMGASPAHACRLHSIWHYPWKQHCPVMTRAVALAPRPPMPHRPAEISIPLPDLKDIDWGQPADEQSLGRLMLRAKMEEQR